MPPDCGKLPVYDQADNQLKILCMGFENQVQYLRLMSDFDLWLFGGYITLQLAMASWLASKPLMHLTPKLGVLLIDVTLGVFAIGLFYYNQKRRAYACGVLRNLSEALGFTVEGAFLKGKVIQDGVPVRPYYPLYVSVVTVTVIAVTVVIFGR